MRPDQYERLQSLAEKLIDTVLVEADPASWPGEGMTTEQWRALEVQSREAAQTMRGNRYWCKKNAAATLTVLTKVYSLTWTVEHRDVEPPPPADDGQDDMDKEIQAAEKEASRILKKVQSRVYARKG